MDASMLAGGLVRRLQYLFGGLLFSFLMAQAVQAAPVVVSVDHRVAVSYSKPQLDARKGSYSVQVRITNKSGAPLLSPLRLSFDKAALGSLAIGNAQGTGADGRPYFDIKLPKEMLVPRASTDPIRIAVVSERGRAVARIEQRFPFKTLEAAQHVSAGVEVAPLEPRAEPYALKANSGKNNVRFSVRMVGQAKSVGAVYLRRVGSNDVVAMNDNGKQGDLVANDNIYGATVSIDTYKQNNDSCLNYEVSLRSGRAEVNSPLLKVCVSSFQVRIAKSNKTKLITFQDGLKAISDEILVRFTPNVSPLGIRNLLANFNASVVGSLLPENLYQARLATSLSREQMLELIAKLKTHSEIVKAYPNVLGGIASVPNDPEFVNQHGIQHIRANDVLDIGATGSGVVVAVLDTGIDRSHPDFGVVGDCQLIDNDCGMSSTDFDITNGHGTAVAGVIAAKTNNLLGVAGVAPSSKIKSILVGADTTYTLAEIRQAFLDASAYGAASVINASLTIGPILPFDFAPPTLDVGDLCASVNSALFNGVNPVAIVVNAAGNNGSNGNYYPGRCNDSTHVLHDQLLVSNKKYFITVANSISTLPIDPVCANASALDQRCGGTTTGVLNTSNYGAWVDIAAPGMKIRTTRAAAIGGGYADFTGTSFAAPMVAGAAAILKSCGVPLDQIESTLRTSANVTVPFPDGSSAPRLDIYRAMMQRNQVPTGVSLTPNNVNENTPTPLEVGTLTAIDADTCDKHTFTIVPGGDGASFNIVGNKLNFNAGVVLDRETKGSYSVTVHAVDFFGAATAADTTLVVTVNDVNEFAVGAVTDTDPAANSVVENTLGAVGLTAHATDADATNNTITYSLTNDAGGRFAINPSTGVVTAVGAIDREAAASYNITVRATSSDGSFSDQVFTINIIDANEFAVGPVTDSNAIMDSVAENSPVGTTVGVTAHAVDADATTNTVTYTLTDDAGGRFAIDPNTGVVTVNGVLDYETATSYSITVQATSSDGSTSSASFSIAVSNVNEAPVANDDTLSATQDTPVTYPNAAMLGNDTDVDAGTTLSIQSVSNGTNGTVMLNGDNSVTFTPAAGYSGAATFSYIATDGALSSNSATVTVNVAAVNHAPVANNDTLAATEDTPVTYPAASLLGNDTDVDAGTTLTIASVSSGAGGTAVLNGDGTVSFTPNANFNGAANFTYTVSDGALNSPSATVMVNVAAVNDNPTGFPVINGTRTVGNNLTADISGIADNDGLGTIHYQWLADGAPVGTDSSLFPLTVGEFGKFMKVQVSYTDGGGTLETIESAQDAVAIGDPHITTVDGLHYDFQSVGEFVALRGKKGMEVQLRMSPVPNATPLTDPNSGLLSAVSVNTGLAARVGAHRVTYQAENGNGPVLRVDGAVAVPPPGGIDLGDGGRVSSLGSGIQIDFPDQTALVANASMWSYYNTWWLQVSVFHTSASEGVMGARSKGSWLPTLSDGSALGPMPALMHDRYVDLYVKFADSWRVTDKSSLFDYAEGTSTATYTDKAWPAENVQPVAHNLLFVMPTARKVALKACQDVLGKNEKADCVFDVMAMGQVEAAKGHLQNQKVRLGATEVLLRAVDRPTLKGEVMFVATVKRLAMVKQERALPAAPAGAVQFLLDGLPVGKPVRLDAKGQATLNLSRFKMGQRNIAARFVPARGTVYLPSINKQAARVLKPVDPVLIRGIR